MGATKASKRALLAWICLWLGCSSPAPHASGGAAGEDQGRAGAGDGGDGGTGGSAGGTPKDAASDPRPDTSGEEPDAATPDTATVDTSGPDRVSSSDSPVTGGPFTLTSSAFKDGDTIAALYRCPPDPNLSPPLSWTPGPAGTRSYAVTLAHGTAIHWQLWDIPAEVTSLPQDVAKVAMPPLPAGSKQSSTGTNGVSTSGYIGPCPQSATVSQYPYTVYALKVATLPGVTAASTPKVVLGALEANSLGTAVLTVNGHK
jgi:Raf kinase inhibitor-like YbhB/YbcL family protein